MYVLLKRDVLITKGRASLIHYTSNHHHTCVHVCVYAIISETCRQKSERILVFSEEGISRSPVAVIAYLIKYKDMSLKVHACIV